MPDVSVLVPFRPSDPSREAAWNWVRAKYSTDHPDWELVTGTHIGDGPFSRTQAILDAYQRASGEVLVVADADIWCDGITDAIEHIDDTTRWAIPHWHVHRLSHSSTQLVLAGEPWHGLPLSTDNTQDSRPYKGHECGTLVVLTRDAFDTAPPDPRFVGWGQEDDAWASALRCLVGAPWRGHADLVHLYHPPQPRQSRTTGNRDGRRLAGRYQAARRRPDVMRALIEEVHGAEQRDVQAQPTSGAPAASLA